MPFTRLLKEFCGAFKESRPALESFQWKSACFWRSKDSFPSENMLLESLLSERFLRACLQKIQFFTQKFLSRKCANMRSPKGLRVSVALPESQPTPARLIPTEVVFNNSSLPRLFYSSFYTSRPVVPPTQPNLLLLANIDHSQHPPSISGSSIEASLVFKQFNLICLHKRKEELRNKFRNLKRRDFIWMLLWSTYIKSYTNIYNQTKFTFKFTCSLQICNN